MVRTIKLSFLSAWQWLLSSLSNQSPLTCWICSKAGGTQLTRRVATRKTHVYFQLCISTVTHLLYMGCWHWFTAKHFFCCCSEWIQLLLQKLYTGCWHWFTAKHFFFSFFLPFFKFFFISEWIQLLLQKSYTDVMLIYSKTPFLCVVSGFSYYCKCRTHLFSLNSNCPCYKFISHW